MADAMMREHGKAGLDLAEQPQRDEQYGQTWHIGNKTTPPN